MKILILCTGNSCRSQMAEGFLKSFDKEIDVCSAGTVPAERIHPITVKVMAEAGIDLSGNSTKSVYKFINDKWDYVITVCDDAYKKCPIFTGTVKHRLHIGFEDPTSATGNEKYITSEFRRVRDLIKREFLNFYNLELKQHKK